MVIVVTVEGTRKLEGCNHDSMTDSQAQMRIPINNQSECLVLPKGGLTPGDCNR